MDRAAWDRAWRVRRKQRFLRVPFQLCEDLFSRVNKNQSAELSYSVEVSVGFGRGTGRGQGARRPWAGVRPRAVSGVRQHPACSGPPPAPR